MVGPPQSLGMHGISGPRHHPSSLIIIVEPWRDGQTKKELIPHRFPPYSFPLIFLQLTCEGSPEELEVAGPPPLEEPRSPSRPAPEEKAETCTEEREGRKE